MVARPGQPLVVEDPAGAAPDQRRPRHGNAAPGAPFLQGGHDARHVGDQAFRQVARLGAGIGDDLLALAVIELLRHLQRAGRRPAEARAAEALQRGQVVQAGRRLPLLLHLHRERPLEALGQGGDGLGILALQDALLRRVPHAQPPGLDLGRRHHLEIALRHEVADLDLAPADDGQRRRLHPSHADHRPGSLRQRHRGGAGEGKVVDLVRLPPRHRRRVEPRMLGIGLRAGEGVADGLRVLRGEHHPHHRAAEPLVLQDLLADQLALAVAVRGQPDAPGRTQGGADRLQLRGLVPACGRPRAIERIRPQQHRAPALPGRVHVFGLHQVEEVPFRRQHRAISAAHRGADVLGLTGLLGDDDLLGHGCSERKSGTKPESECQSRKAGARFKFAAARSIALP